MEGKTITVALSAESLETIQPGAARGVGTLGWYGFWFLDVPNAYAPPADLSAYLSDGAPPVYACEDFLCATDGWWFACDSVWRSFDGGKTWPVQGHVPGYEGWTDNTDPVGAFDPWGNFYSLVLPYQFYYDKFGGHKFDNGTNQTNPALPPEAIAVSVHPAQMLPGKTPAAS